MAVIKYLASLDLSQNELIKAVVQNLPTVDAPASPNDGQIYWDTTVHSLFVWSSNTSSWIDLGVDGVTNLSYNAAVSNGVVTSDTGTDATIPLADATNAGLFSASEKTKLGDIEENAKDDQNASEVPSTPSGNLSATNVQDALNELQVDINELNNATNDLSITHNASDVDIVIEDGADIVLNAATTSLAGAMTGADKTKLDGIAASADVNVSTNLSEGSTTTTTVDVDSSDGTNATLQQASSTRAGLLSSAKFDEIEANTLKVSDINHNVTTNLSEGTTTTTSVNVNSSDGTNATLAQASSSRAGVLSSAKFDEIVANTLKETNVSTNISVVENASTVSINSSDGTDDTIAAVSDTLAGVMLPAQKTKLDGIAAGAEVNVDDVLTSLGLAANVLTYTDEEGNDTDIDLSLYLDDTNLARLTNGSINGSTGLATFTRDDASTFTIDMSAFLDSITLNDTLTSTSTTEGLTANQGKVLKDLIDVINTNNTGTNTGDQDLSGYLLNTTDILDGELTVKGLTSDNLGNALIVRDSSESALFSVRNDGRIDASGNILATGTVTGSNLSGTNTGDQDLSGYLLNTTDTFTGALTIDGDIRGNGQQLVLNVGESFQYATGQTDEYLYVNAESGLQINSSPDNWLSGWAGRQIAYINKADASSHLPGLLEVAGDINIGTYSNTNTGSLFLNGVVANKRGEIQCTNGNLHIDPDTENGTYLNYYKGTSGTHFGNGAGVINASISSAGNFLTTGTVLGSNLSGTNTGDEVQATTTVQGIVELATNTEANTGTATNRAITPANLKSVLGTTGTLSSALTYTALIGDAAATSIAVTHSIGRKDVQSQVFDTTFGNMVVCEIENTSTTVTTFKFNTAPALNELRVVIIG